MEVINLIVEIDFLMSVFNNEIIADLKCCRICNKINYHKLKRDVYLVKVKINL